MYRGEVDVSESCHWDFANERQLGSAGSTGRRNTCIETVHRLWFFSQHGVDGMWRILQCGALSQVLKALFLSGLQILRIIRLPSDTAI